MTFRLIFWFLTGVISSIYIIYKLNKDILEEQSWGFIDFLIIIVSGFAGIFTILAGFLFFIAYDRVKKN